MDERLKNLKDVVLAGAFWMFSGTSLHVILQVLFLCVLARLLSPADYGLVAAASAVLGISAIFSQLGIGPAIVQRSKLKEEHLRTGFSGSLLFGAFLTGVISILAPYISNLLRMGDLAKVLRVLSLSFIFQGCSVVSLALLQRELKFKRIVSIEVGSYFAGYGIVGIPMPIASTAEFPKDSPLSEGRTKMSST